MSKDDIPIDDNNLHDFKLKDIINIKTEKKLLNYLKEISIIELES